VSRPTRGSNQNRELINDAEQVGDELLLPSVEAGVTLLDVDSSRGVPILQSLVLDQLLLDDGPAFWVDANGHATTTTLAQIAPSQRLLDRIHVARGFTAYQHYGAVCAYQHYGAVCDLSAAVNQSIQEWTDNIEPRGRQPAASDNDSSPHTPSLIVAPAVDAQCRTDDTFGEAHKKLSKPEHSPAWRPTLTATTFLFSSAAASVMRSRSRSKRPPTTIWSASKRGWDHELAGMISRRSSIPSTAAHTTRRPSPTGDSCSMPALRRSVSNQRPPRRRLPTPSVLASSLPERRPRWRRIPCSMHGLLVVLEGDSDGANQPDISGRPPSD